MWLVTWKVYQRYQAQKERVGGRASESTPCGHIHRRKRSSRATRKKTSERSSATRPRKTRDLLITVDLASPTIYETDYRTVYTSTHLGTSKNQNTSRLTVCMRDYLSRYVMQARPHATHTHVCVFFPSTLETCTSLCSVFWGLTTLCSVFPLSPRFEPVTWLVARWLRGYCLDHRGDRVWVDQSGGDSMVQR